MTLVSQHMHSVHQKMWYVLPCTRAISSSSISTSQQQPEQCLSIRRATKFSEYCSEVDLLTWICDFEVHSGLPVTYHTNYQLTCHFHTIIQHNSKAHKIKFQKFENQYKNYTEILHPYTSIALPRTQAYLLTLFQPWMTPAAPIQ